MRLKILLVWLWFLLLPWAGMSCGQGASEIPQDGGQQSTDANDDAGSDASDQDFDANDGDPQADGDGEFGDSDPLADGDGESTDAGWDGADDDDDGGLSDAGDEENPVCLSGEVPALGGLSPEELHAALADKDFLLINVASANGGQIAGTDAYVPYDDPDALAEFIGPDLRERVVLYCVSSGRSGVAGRSLVERGYCSIRHLLGGMNAWTAAGFPLE